MSSNGIPIFATKGRADGKGGLAPRTIGHAHRVLSSALNDAAENDLVLAQCHAKQIAAQGAGRGNGHRAGRSGFRCRDKGEWPQPVCPGLVSLFTGMRRNEVLALKWGRVDLDRNIVRVHEALEFTKAHGIRFKRQNPRPDVATLRCPIFWSMCCATIARRSLNFG